jgi:hypothetical protein
MITKEWKGIGVVVVLVSLLAAAVVPFVMAAEIQCTVTTGIYSVTLDRTTVNYGAMVAEDEKVDPNGANYANNSGTLTEDIMIRGEDAEGPGATPARWTLGNEPGVNIYTHTFNAGTETSLTTDDQPLAEDVLAGQEVGFTLKLYTPTTIDTNGDYSFSVYVVAMAPS